MAEDEDEVGPLASSDNAHRLNGLVRRPEGLSSPLAPSAAPSIMISTSESDKNSSVLKHVLATKNPNGRRSLDEGSMESGIAKSISMFSSPYKQGPKLYKKASAWADKNFADTLEAEDLGIAFRTRAAGAVPDADGNTGDKRASTFEKFVHLRSLSRIFPTTAGTDPFQDPNSPQNLYAPQRSLSRGFSFIGYFTCCLCLCPGKPLRELKAYFHSASWTSMLFEQTMRLSALVSCVYVIGAIGLEPGCVPGEVGSTFERLSVPEWRPGAIFGVLHALNASLYLIMSLAGRLMLGYVDRRRCEELELMADIFCAHLGTPGFYLDLLSIIGLVAEYIHLGEVQVPGLPSASQWLMLLQLLKLWRVSVPKVHMSSDPEKHHFLKGVCFLFFSLGLFAHTEATILMWIGNLESYLGKPSWIDTLKDENNDGGAPCMKLYTEALYFAVLSLTSVGYGDKLITTYERGVNTLLMLLAQLFTAKVCADLTWLTSTHNHWEAQHQARRAQTWVALKHMQVPHVLAQRVLAFQSYVATVHREDLEQPALAGLSENLVKELRLCCYRKLVLQAPFLKEQPKEVISLIVGSLRDSVYLPADFIVRQGERGRELFFVRRGRAGVFLGIDAPTWGNSEEVTSYEPGAYFGELAMLTGRPRAAWVMAKSYCVCSVLPYSAVETLSLEHPGSFTTLVQSMVRSFNFQASLTWDEVARRMCIKYGFESIQEAFDWMCALDVSEKHDVDHQDELSAKGFDMALRRLKVPELDRKMFWSEIDTDNSGTICYEEFALKMTIAPNYSSEPASPTAEQGRTGRCLTADSAAAQTTSSASVGPSKFPGRPSVATGVDTIAENDTLGDGSEPLAASGGGGSSGRRHFQTLHRQVTDNGFLLNRWRREAQDIRLNQNCAGTELKASQADVQLGSQPYSFDRDSRLNRGSIGSLMSSELGGTSDVRQLKREWSMASEPLRRGSAECYLEAPRPEFNRRGSSGSGMGCSMSGDINADEMLLALRKELLDMREQQKELTRSVHKLHHAVEHLGHRSAPARSYTGGSGNFLGLGD